MAEHGPQRFVGIALGFPMASFSSSTGPQVSAKATVKGGGSGGSAVVAGGQEVGEGCRERRSKITD